MRKPADITLISCLALALTSTSGCYTSRESAAWPLFYDCEKGPEHLSIALEPRSLAFFTTEIPEWNYDLRIPRARITGAKAREMGEIGGLRVVEVRLSLQDIYYSDAVMILQEIKKDQFMPVYVQDYNQHAQTPSESRVLKKNSKLIIEAGMDYVGSGNLHNQYQIVFAPNHSPLVTGTGY